MGSVSADKRSSICSSINYSIGGRQLEQYTISSNKTPPPEGLLNTPPWFDFVRPKQQNSLAGFEFVKVRLARYGIQDI